MAKDHDIILLGQVFGKDRRPWRGSNLSQRTSIAVLLNTTTGEIIYSVGHGFRDKFLDFPTMMIDGHTRIEAGKILKHRCSVTHRKV